MHHTIASRSLAGRGLTARRGRRPEVKGSDDLEASRPESEGCSDARGDGDRFLHIRAIWTCT